MVELLRDTALALAPLTHDRALALIGETRLGQRLHGYRGARPGDRAALAALLVQLSDIGLRYGALIQAIDLNPVIVAPEGLCVADALIVPGPGTHSTIPEGA